MFISCYKKIAKRKAPKSYKGKPLPYIWVTAAKLLPDCKIVQVKLENIVLSGWLEGDKVICSLYTYNPIERRKMTKFIRNSAASAVLFIEKD